MRNTISKEEYLLDHVTYMIVSFIWWYNFLFRCFPGKSFAFSLGIGLCIIISIIAIEILVFYEHWRTRWSVIGNIITAYGVWLGVAYFDIFKGRYIVAGIVTFVVTAILWFIIYCRRIPMEPIYECRPRRIFRVREIRKQNAIRCLKNNIAIAMSVMLIMAGGSVLLRGTILNSSVSATMEYGEEYTIAANIEEISKIVWWEWMMLDVEERLAIAQTIVNCEANYRGLTHEVSVGVGALSEGVTAHYNEQRHQIVIDIDYLEGGDGEQICETLIHETFHAWEYEMVNIYNQLSERQKRLQSFEKIAVYAKEFANYEDEGVEYYMQQSEIDARSAAEIGIKEYMTKIEEYRSRKK